MDSVSSLKQSRFASRFNRNCGFHSKVLFLAPIHEPSGFKSVPPNLKPRFQTGLARRITNCATAEVVTCSELALTFLMACCTLTVPGEYVPTNLSRSRSQHHSFAR